MREEERRGRGEGEGERRRGEGEGERRKGEGERWGERRSSEQLQCSTVELFSLQNKLSC